jgi:hypothetical protein
MSTPLKSEKILRFAFRRASDLANHGVAQPDVERNAAGRSGILSRHRIKLATATLARSRKESRPRKRTGS